MLAFFFCMGIQARLSREPWSLEIPQVQELLLKIRHNGTALSEYSGLHPLIGIMPGLSEAYLVDTNTRNILVQRDTKCAKLIKPYLRGQDLRRWHPEWAGLWMIAMGSSNDTEWPWASTTDETEAEEAFEKTYPSLHSHFKSFEEALSSTFAHFS